MALLYYNWKLALMTFIVLPLLVLATIVFRKKVRAIYREVRIRLARLNAFVQEHINGMTVIQLFNRENEIYSDFLDINGRLHVSSS